MIELVREHLASVQSNLDARLKERMTICDGAAAERQTLEGAVETMQEMLSKATFLVKERKEGVHTEEQTLSSAEKTLSDSVKKCNTATKERDAVSAKSESMRSLYEDNFKVLAETSEKRGKQIKKLYDVLE